MREQLVVVLYCVIAVVCLCVYVRSVSLPHGALCWSVASECGIS